MIGYYSAASNNEKYLEILTDNVGLRFQDINKATLPHNFELDFAFGRDPNANELYSLFWREVGTRNLLGVFQSTSSTTRPRYGWWLGSLVADRYYGGYIGHFPVLNERGIFKTKLETGNILKHYYNGIDEGGQVVEPNIAGLPSNSYTIPNSRTWLLLNLRAKVWNIKIDGYEFAVNEGSGDILTATDGTILKIEKENGNSVVEGVDYIWH